MKKVWQWHVGHQLCLSGFPRMNRTEVDSFAVLARVREVISTVIVIVSWKRLNLRIVGSISFFCVKMQCVYILRIFSHCKEKNANNPQFQNNIT